MRRYVPYILIALAYTALCFHRVSTLPLIDPDEPRYAGAAREMAEGGSLLVPEFNGQPRINKPPLFYWLTAISMRACGGASELSARLPSIVAGLLMLAITIALGSRLYSRRVGLVAGAVLTTTPLFFVLARTCVTDMTFSAFSTLALAAVLGFVAMPREPSRSRRLALLFVVGFGLAVLAKATPAFCAIAVVVADLAFAPSGSGVRDSKRALVLLALACFASFVNSRIDPDDQEKLSKALGVATSLPLILVIGIGVRRAFRSPGRLAWRGARWLALPLVGVLMGAWWYVAIAVVQGWPRFAELLRFEIGARLEGSVHREGVYYFAGIVPLVLLPWSLALPQAIARAWRSSRSRSTTQERADAFLLAWVVGVVFFFSVPGGKLITYVLPALPAAALLVARALVAIADRSNADEIPHRIGSGLTLALLRGSSIVCALAACVLLVRSEPIGDAISSRVLGVALAFLSAGLFFGSRRLAAGDAGFGVGLLATGIVLALTIGLMASPQDLEVRSQRAIASKLTDILAPYDRVVSRGVRIESFAYYLHRPVSDITDVSRDGSVIERFDGELRAGSRVAIVLKGSSIGKVLGEPAAIPTLWPSDARIIAREDDVVVIARPMR